MTACIFLGPSLSVAQAEKTLPEARFLEPVQHGDVYRAMQRWSPRIIGIIDGYFQHSPSVWHKEILWALDQGVHVVGAASMGALRAAELEAFGMVGVGKIYDEFRAGALPPFDGLTDDDEVAVTHGPRETGFVAVSEAMVNIRFTLRKAAQAGVISTQTASYLCTTAKSLHFPQRQYSNLLTLAAHHGVDAAELDALRTWLHDGKVDQKHVDASALITYVKHWQQAGGVAAATDFHFENTEIWHDTTSAMTAAQTARDITVEQLAILKELRLDEKTYKRVMQRAALRYIAGPLPNNDNDLDDTKLRRAVDRFRQAFELWDRHSIDTWLAANDLALEQFDVLMHGEVRLNAWLHSLNSALLPAIVDQLRLTGEYSALAQRAHDKAIFLRANEKLGKSRRRPSERQLIHWYFEERTKREIPDNIEEYARDLGFDTRTQFVDAVADEFVYVTESSRSLG